MTPDPDREMRDFVSPVEPRMTSRSAQPYAGVRRQVAREALPAAVPPALQELNGFLQTHRLQPSGPALIRYLVVDYNMAHVEIDVGLPLDVADTASLPADPRVRLQRLPAGTFATVIHHGPYDSLVKTTAGLLEWARTQRLKWDMVEEGKLTRWAARVEHYLVGPDASQDPAAWRTEIAILLAAAPTNATSPDDGKRWQ
jgi:effector-binding domain-containing protein